MQAREVASWFFCPILAILASWLLLLFPHTTQSMVPGIWNVGDQTDFDKDLPDDLKMPFIMKNAHLISTVVSTVIVFLYAGFLLVLTNLFLPTVVSKWPNYFASAVLMHTIAPVVALLRSRFFAESFVYAAAFTLCVQGSRYPADRSIAGISVSLMGGVSLVLCWLRTTATHVHAGRFRRSILFKTGVFIGSVFTPLALLHRSQLLGTIGVLASHGALTLLVDMLGVVSHRVGDGWRGLLGCGAISSMMLALTLLSLQLLGFGPDQLHVFCIGGVYLGHVAYFAILLVLTSKWVAIPGAYRDSQGVAVISLAVTLFLGKVAGKPALSSTTWVATLLWLMLKELEHQYDGFGSKLLAVYVLAQFLDKETALSALDPANLYA